MTASLPGAVLATAGTWHDHVPAVAAAALSRLRLSATDPDADRFQPMAAGACSAIDQRLQLLPLEGRMAYVVAGIQVVTFAPDDAPPDVLEAAVQLTIGLYHRADAPLGVVGRGMGEGLYVSRDQLAQVSSLLDPYVEGVGLA